MNTCKDCKWWSITDYKSCDFVKTTNAVNESTGFFIYTVVRNKQDINDRLKTRLITMPDFGRINFKSN